MSVVLFKFFLWHIIKCGYFGDNWDQKIIRIFNYPQYILLFVHLFQIGLFTEKPGKPDAPEITNIKSRSVGLQWKPPTNNGGDEIFNYIVEYRSEGTFKWTRANVENLPATYYTATGLREKENYEFRISAENRAGVGPASDPTSPIRPKSPVGKSRSQVFQ